MKKSRIIIIAVVIILLIGGILLFGKENNKTNVKLKTAEDLISVIEKMNEETHIDSEVRGIETRELDIKDEFALQTYTGLKDSKKIDTVVVSESMMTSVPYSITIVKVKNKADVETIKKEMVDNIDMRRWICVEAETIYSTSSDNVIILAMAEELNARRQYDAFRDIVGGTFGKELIRNAEITDFDDMENDPTEVVVQ